MAHSKPTVKPQFRQIGRPQNRPAHSGSPNQTAHSEVQVPGPVEAQIRTKGAHRGSANSNQIRRPTVEAQIGRPTSLPKFAGPQWRPKSAHSVPTEEAQLRPNLPAYSEAHNCPATVEAQISQPIVEAQIGT